MRKLRSASQENFTRCVFKGSARFHRASLLRALRVDSYVLADWSG